jgi:putative membrane protein
MMRNSIYSAQSAALSDEGEKTMRRRLTVGFFFGFLAISLFGCADNRTSYSEAPNRPQENMNTRGANPINGNTSVPSANEMTNNKASTMTGDTDFMTKAALGGMAEVELGKLAATKAQSAEVKQFAQKMVAEHTKANDELKALAGEKNFSMPVRLDAKHQAVMDKLNGLSGADFDKAYVEAMVADHEETVATFKSEADGGKDADVKAWAGKTLPNLQMHLDMIKGIQAKMK